MNASISDQPTQGLMASPAEFAGFVVGERAVEYQAKDAILYAIAVGAQAHQLHLVDETRLEVLPTFALPLTQWALDVLAERGAWDLNNALHGAQALTVLRPLPRQGKVTMRAHVGAVYDKGTAALYEIVVESDYFVATWTIFAPGRGGFGGERGPSASPVTETQADWDGSWTVPPNQAVLYRLCGDWHRIHIDPEAAEVAGMKAPILHGLATLASTLLKVAESLDLNPATATSLEALFASPVYPGDKLEVQRWGSTEFAVKSPQGPAISRGTVTFGEPGRRSV